jgi:putative ABC transport system permease protein
MDSLLQDIRHAFRRLGRSPGFTGLVALVLALGIGGTAITFSVVDAVLLRPLDFPHSGELVRVFSLWEQGVMGTASPPDFEDWRAQNRSFTELAAMNEGSFALTGDGPAEQIPGSQVTGGFFAVMGVRPLLGRVMTPGDDAFDGPKVAVLSYTLWRRRFGGDSSAVGRPVRLDGETYTVLGVMPPGFTYPSRSELWLPQRFSAADLSTQRGAHYLDVIGRLRPGVTLAAAGRDMRRIAANLTQAYPRSNAHSGAAVTSLRDAMVGDVRAPLLILLGAVAVVLLIACTNVAGLLVVRGIGREREIAIRTALGAGRRRVMRTLLVESVALAVLGGLAGTLLTVWGTDLIARLGGLGIPLLGETRVDPGVLAFTGILTLATALLFGLLPAWQTTTGGGLAARLHAEGRGTTGGRLRTRNGLVVAQTALAVLLLVGAGLLIRSFARLQRVDPGFDPRHVLTFGISLPDAAYPKPQQSALFYQDLLQRLEALPGVQSAGAVFGLPLTGFGYSISLFELDGRVLAQEEQERLSLQIRVVTPDYFSAMGIRVRRGRGIAATDRPGSPPVIVINEAAARAVWPGQDPLGHRVFVGTRLGLGGDRVGGEVVGVIGDLKERGLGRSSLPTIYLAHAQAPVGFMGVAIRSTGDPESLVAPARAVLTAVDPDVPMFRLRTMRQLVDADVAQPKAYTLLLTIFALVAITLASVGLYGVLSQSVAQRGRELGVRIALGASARDVVALVLRQGVMLAGAGVALGLLTAMAATRALRSLLFGVGTQDPVTFALVGGGLFLVAVTASLVPARRATRVDPMEALRTE